MRTRTESIQLRATPKEKARITQHAKRCKLTITQYLLQLANDYTPMAFPNEAFFNVCAELTQMRKLLERYCKTSNQPVTNTGMELTRTIQRIDRVLHALEERFLFSPLESQQKGGESDRDNQDMVD